MAVVSALTYILKGKINVFAKFNCQINIEMNWSIKVNYIAIVKKTMTQKASTESASMIESRLQEF